MARSTRDGRPVKVISVYMDEDLWKRMNDYSKRNGVSKTFIVERSVRLYLDKVDGDDDRVEQDGE